MAKLVYRRFGSFRKSAWAMIHPEDPDSWEDQVNEQYAPHWRPETFEWTSLRGSAEYIPDGLTVVKKLADEKKFREAERAFTTKVTEKFRRDFVRAANHGQRSRR
jgi:hypothetical protein